MRELTQKVKCDLDGDELCIYDDIVNNLKVNENSNIDIEGILSVIQYILDRDNQTNIGDITTFQLNKNNCKSHIRDYYDNIKLTKVRLKLTTSIRKHCTRSPNLGYVSEVYTDFFNKIIGGLGVGSYTDGSIIKYHKYWSVFTTNYDTIFEDF
jgi:hypothetical protein